MQTIKQHTLNEIKTQPQAWQQALEVTAEQADALLRLWQDGQYDQVIFTGCGSTFIS
jgi:glucosamine--fructose-6-phosphate aminotransferase (isomerizing)